jgi:hypothetical protein
MTGSPLTSIDKITFTASIVREYSSSPRPDDLGTHESTMELFNHGDPCYYSIEWYIPEIDEVVDYGIWCQHFKGVLTLTDYDGGFSLPKQAIGLLRKNNIVVPKDFE